MKKFFKLCVFSLSVALILVFTGCSARSAITADEFQKQAKSEGFTVASQTPGDSGASSCFLATKNGSNLQVLYYAFSDASAAQNWYSAQKNGFAATGKTTVDSDSYNKYNVTVGDMYYLLVRMDNTGIVCKTTPSQSGDANNFISSIKY